MSLSEGARRHGASASSAPPPRAVSVESSVRQRTADENQERAEPETYADGDSRRRAWMTRDETLRARTELRFCADEVAERSRERVRDAIGEVRLRVHATLVPAFPQSSRSPFSLEFEQSIVGPLERLKGSRAPAGVRVGGLGLLYVGASQLVLPDARVAKPERFGVLHRTAVRPPRCQRRPHRERSLLSHRTQPDAAPCGRFVARELPDVS